MVSSCRVPDRLFPLLLGLFATLSVTGPTRAQTTFNPAITLQQLYTDNVSFLGEEKTSDTYTQLSVVFPVTRQLRRGSLNFVYQPSAQRYNEFGSLDNLAHTLRFGVDTQPSKQSAFGLNTSYFRTQDQGQSDPNLVVDPFLSGRATHELADLGLNYSRNLRRWRWNVGGHFSALNVKQIEDFSPGAQPVETEDRTSSQGSFGIARNVSSSTHVGLAYSYQQFELDVSGGQSVQSVSITVDRRIARHSSLTLRVGVFEADQKGLNLDVEDTVTGLTAGLGLGRDFRRASLRLDLDHSPAAGGTRRGTSEDTSLTLSLASAKDRDWLWLVSALYAMRDPTDAQQSTLETQALGLSVSRSVTRLLAVALTANVADQTGDDLLDEGTFFRAGLGVTFFPLGRTRVASGN